MPSLVFAWFVVRQQESWKYEKKVESYGHNRIQKYKRRGVKSTQAGSKILWKDYNRSNRVRFISVESGTSYTLLLYNI